MKGSNELRINHSTMIEALQLWVDANFTAPPRVESVEQLNNMNYLREFSVKVTDPINEEVK